MERGLRGRRLSPARLAEALDRYGSSKDLADAMRGLMVLRLRDA
jgi:hypothetical protein